jgi:AbrB family looped-hinge helix DNA binding protein
MRVMATIAQVSSAGQLTIPAAIRKELGLNAGDHVQLSVQDHRIVVEAVIVAPKLPTSEVVDAAKRSIARNSEAFDRLAEL